MRREKKLLAAFHALSVFSPEEDLEVLGPQHFLLPTILLACGLLAASFTFLLEIYFNK